MSERTALYRLYDADDVLLYVGISRSIGNRWTAHRDTKYWWRQVVRRDVTWLDRRRDALLAEHLAILAEHPLHNSPKDPQGWISGIGRPVPGDSREVIAAELCAAHKIEDRKLRHERQRQVVMKALDAGWSKYAIAQAMGVTIPTVNSIVATMKRRVERAVA